MKVLVIAVLTLCVYIVTCQSLNGSTTSKPDENRIKLIENAIKLMDEVKKEIEVLTKGGQTAAADELKKEEDKLKKLVSELENDTDKAKIEEHLNELTQLYAKIQELLKKDKNKETSQTHEGSTTNPNIKYTTSPQPTSTTNTPLHITTQVIPSDCINFVDIFSKSTGIQQKVKNKIQELTDAQKITEAAQMVDQEKDFEKINDKLKIYFQEVLKLITDLNAMEYHILQNTN